MCCYRSPAICLYVEADTAVICDPRSLEPSALLIQVCLRSWNRDSLLRAWFDHFDTAAGLGLGVAWGEPFPALAVVDWCMYPRSRLLNKNAWLLGARDPSPKPYG